MDTTTGKTEKMSFLQKLEDDVRIASIAVNNDDRIHCTLFDLQEQFGNDEVSWHRRSKSLLRSLH